MNSETGDHSQTHGTEQGFSGGNTFGLRASLTQGTKKKTTFGTGDLIQGMSKVSTQSSLTQEKAKQSTKKVKQQKLQLFNLATMRQNFMVYGTTKKQLTAEEAHQFLINPLKAVNFNPEQKDGVNIAIVQGLPVIKFLSPPGTGKTMTAAEVAVILGKKPGKRVLVLAPTNLASHKVTHSTLEAYINHGRNPNEEEYDVLMLESRDAALSAAG